MMPKDQVSNNMPVVTIIGSGLIGCSWAALMAATGRRVLLFDTRPGAGETVGRFWKNVRPELVALNLLDPNLEPIFEECATLENAVSRADFIFECIPERLDAKLELYRAIEPGLKPRTIVATSTSGLTLSELQEGWADPSRLIIAHPFNPPHLVPLVELVANDRTDPDVLPRARELYESCGKVTITLKREVMGHVANRLQAAIWREAVHLVESGVCSVKDVDTAIWAGPGLRWSIMGPHMLLNLGGGEGGLHAYCEQFSDSYAKWWDDLGKPKLDAPTIAKLVEGIAEESEGRDYATLRRERDAQLVAVLRALSETRASFQKTVAPA
jgi:carnitine 3-dehydrogenase